MLDGLHRAALAFSRATAILGGGLLLLSALAIGVDVVMRNTISRSIGGADELSGYALAIASVWGLGFAALHRAHIRIDSLYELLGAPIRMALDLLAVVGTLLFAILAVWHGWSVAAQSLASGARSISAIEAPLAVPQLAWLAGLAFFAATLLLVLVEALVAAARGRRRRFFALVGSKAIAEEIQEEVESAGVAPARAEPPR